MNQKNGDTNLIKKMRMSVLYFPSFGTYFSLKISISYEKKLQEFFISVRIFHISSKCACLFDYSNYLLPFSISQ